MVSFEQTITLNLFKLQQDILCFSTLSVFLCYRWILCYNRVSFAHKHTPHLTELQQEIMCLKLFNCFLKRHNTSRGDEGRVLKVVLKKCEDGECLSHCTIGFHSTLQFHFLMFGATRTTAPWYLWCLGTTEPPNHYVFNCMAKPKSYPHGICNLWPPSDRQTITPTVV